MTAGIVFLFLLFGHYIGDFALQTQFLSENKHKYFYVMFAHGMIYTGVISAILFYFGDFAMWKAAFIVIGHCVCDWVRGDEYFYPDQIWHIIQLAIVWAV